MVSGALFGCFPLHRYFCNFAFFFLLLFDLEKTVINKSKSEPRGLLFVSSGKFAL